MPKLTYEIEAECIKIQYGRDAPSPHVKNAAGEDFSKYKVDGLKSS